ncbi:MAG TPA: acyl carrier protein [Ruminiclostridium sp.]|nr:acyl carrier protein [Ruminiclostridium sp.]
MTKPIESKEQIVHEIKEILLGIINADLSVGLSINNIKDDDEIATSTVMGMDSIKAIKMIVEIERKFGISVPDEDLDMKNFKNVEVIASYIIMKKSSGVC